MMDNVAFMLGHWQFDFDEWWVLLTAILLVAGLPLAIAAGWRRLYSRSAGRALMVTLFNFLAFSALFLLLTEPRREHLTSQNIILITQGSDLSEVPLGEADKLYIAPDALQEPADQQIMANANWLLDVGQLRLREPALSEIKLHGYGLSRSQWQSLPDQLQITFSAPALVGFTDMRWPRTLTMGETLAIDGKFSAAQPDSIVEIRVIDPAGDISAERRIRSGEPFHISVRPKSQGNTQYRLQAWHKDTLLSDQPVSISVQLEKPLQILVKQSAPSYETRQLKDFAASLGSEVLLDTQISKGKAITQMVNQAETSDSSFSPATLASSDWLIIDGRALSGLPEVQRQWLFEALQAGLGMLVFADESLLDDSARLSRDLLQGFVLTADTSLDEEVVPQLQGVAGGANELPLPALPAHLNSSPGQAPSHVLVTDLNGRALVAARTQGLGKVAITLISQSYRWVTAGHRANWSDYWANLSTALSRPADKNILIPPSDNAFLRKNQRAQICALSDLSSVSVQISVVPSNSAIHNSPASADPFAAPSNQATAGNRLIHLPLSADSMGSARKCGWYWPASEGWQRMQLLSDESSQVLDRQWQYVWATEQWPAQTQFERLAASANQIALSESAEAPLNSQKPVTEALSLFWLWLLFISAASALWLERKLDWDAA